MAILLGAQKFRERLRCLCDLQAHIVEIAMTDGPVKFVPAVYFFKEKNVFSYIICIEAQNLHTPSVILLLNCEIFTNLV